MRMRFVGGSFAVRGVRRRTRRCVSSANLASRTVEPGGKESVVGL